MIKSGNSLSVLYLIIPCYNEEAVLPVTAPLFLNKLTEMMEEFLISDKSRILFVNDGSRDATWDIIQTLAKADEHYIGISQSRNRGHQNAVLAGLMEVKGVCDITISIDCDGQDDIDVMSDMVERYREGYEIVYGARSTRSTDTFLKRFTAESFYRVLQWMGVEVVFNHADYRLISSRVLEELSNFREVNIYLRGLIPLVGFKSTTVYYERHERMAGEGHYPLSKMLGLAFDGITSLSIRPIRLIAGMGMLVSMLSFLLIIWILIQFFTGNTVQGWASSCAIVCLMGGIQLICIGVVGEYIGKIYLETKARPRWVISDRTYEYEKLENGYLGEKG